MKSYINFKRELGELLSFHRATTYSYELTETTLVAWKKNKFEFNKNTDLGLHINQPNHYNVKKSSRQKIRKNLNELVFVRTISALEVFLVDLIRDVFLETRAI